MQFDILKNILKSIGLDWEQETYLGNQIILFFSLIVRDCLAVEGYLEKKQKIDAESNLKDKLATMCHLYDITDAKLYDRAALMQVNDNLHDQISQFLDYLDKKRKLNNININVDYFKTDVR